MEHWVVQQVEDREDGRACWVEKHCSLDGSPDAKLSHWCAADFCHDSLEEYKEPAFDERAERSGKLAAEAERGLSASEPMVILACAM